MVGAPLVPVLERSHLKHVLETSVTGVLVTHPPLIGRKEKEREREREREMGDEPLLRLEWSVCGFQCPYQGKPNKTWTEAENSNLYNTIGY